MAAIRAVCGGHRPTMTLPENQEPAVNDSQDERLRHRGCDVSVHRCRGVDPSVGDERG